MNPMKIGGWILSVLVTCFMVFGSAMGKFTEWEGKQAMFDHLGYSAETITTIGVLEIAFAVLFLVPKLEFFGALLLTAYLGGAVATHVRVGDPFFFPIIVGFLCWLAFTLRNERFRSYLKGQ